MENRFPSESEYEDFCKEFEAEQDRKEALFEMFDFLAKKEILLKKAMSKARKYERRFSGEVWVTEISAHHIGFREPSGAYGKLYVDPEISRLIRLDDLLELKMGFRDEFWRVIYVSSICSSLGDKAPPIAPQVH